MLVNASMMVGIPLSSASSINDAVCDSRREPRFNVIFSSSIHEFLHRTKRLPTRDSVQGCRSAIAAPGGRGKAVPPSSRAADGLCSLFMLSLLHPSPDSLSSLHVKPLLMAAGNSGVILRLLRAIANCAARIKRARKRQGGGATRDHAC